MQLGLRTNIFFSNVLHWHCWELELTHFTQFDCYLFCASLPERKNKKTLFALMWKSGIFADLNLENLWPWKLCMRFKCEYSSHMIFVSWTHVNTAFHFLISVNCNINIAFLHRITVHWVYCLAMKKSLKFNFFFVKFKIKKSKSMLSCGLRFYTLHYYLKQMHCKCPLN